MSEVPLYLAPRQTRGQSGSPTQGRLSSTRKVDVRLPGQGDSQSHGARPVHLIITTIKWTRTSRLSRCYLAPRRTRGQSGSPTPGRAPRSSHAARLSSTRKVDVRLPGNGNSNSHGARPCHPPQPRPAQPSLLPLWDMGCTVFMALGFGRQLPPGIAGGKTVVEARG